MGPELLMMLIPTIVSALGSAGKIAADTSNANRQLKQQQAQFEYQEQQKKNQIASERAINYSQQQANNQTIADNYRSAMGNESLSSGTTVNSTGIGVQGLNGQTGYLNEEEQTNYQCGGRRKRAFGGKNKVDSASIYVSPNNMPVKSDSNNIVNYRDRLAQFKLGGRKC